MLTFLCLVTFSFQGRFEIISLSGSFLLSESNGSRSRTGGLSVSLAGSDGRVLGGGVAGMLTAASAVQVFTLPTSVFIHTAIICLFRWL
jgi:predicted DNA-binding protein with PD1-like motif